MYTVKNYKMLLILKSYFQQLISQSDEQIKINTEILFQTQSNEQNKQNNQIQLDRLAKMPNFSSQPKDSQYQGQRCQITRPSAIIVAKFQQVDETSMLTQPDLQQHGEPSSAVKKSTSQKVQQIVSLFKITEIPTKNYRQIVEEIAQSLTTIDCLTNNLQEKVDRMLRQQQQEFVDSYKSHMKKIQEEFSSVDKKIQQYEKKIAYYENQGEMSQLFIKVNRLEQECKKLYKDLAEKDKASKDHLLTIKVQKSEIKRYEKELKSLLRQKNNLTLKVDQLKTQIQNQKSALYHRQQFDPKVVLSPKCQKSERQQLQKTLKNMNSGKSLNSLLFPTQLQTGSKNEKNTHDISTEYHFGSHHSKSRDQILIKPTQKSLTLDLSLQKGSPVNSQNPSLLAKVREMQLKREVQSLKKKNQMLNSFQSQVLQAKTDMESLFVDCVNQIKQQIKIRKKITYCTLDDWKKQDKIQLLIRIISNDDILAHLYERIFNKKRLFGAQFRENDKNKYLQTLGENRRQVDLTIARRFQGQNLDRPQLRVKDKSFEVKKEQKKQKILSIAKRRFSKHISQNSLLPKLQFHLQY